MWFLADGSVTYTPAVPTPEPPRRRALSVRLGLVLAVVLVLLGGSAAAAVGRGWLRLGGGAGPLGPASVHTAGGRAPAVGAGDRHASAGPQAARQTRFADRIQDALDMQATALLAGDGAAFVAVADPAVQPELRRRFDALHAMRVAGWDETLMTGPESAGGEPPRWKADVRLRYCFGVPGCTPIGVTVPTEWTDVDGQPRLVSMGTSGPTDLGPRPWEVTDLRVAVGARVIVAAPGRYAGRLQSALASAEQAAAVTDRYARWGAPPGRYLVFLA